MENDTIKIEFPPLETKEQESVTRLLQTLGELMDVDFDTKQIVIMQVQFDADRQDVKNTLIKVVQTLKNKRKEQKP